MKKNEIRSYFMLIFKHVKHTDFGADSIQKSHPCEQPLIPHTRVLILGSNRNRTRVQYVLEDAYYLWALRSGKMANSMDSMIVILPKDFTRSFLDHM